MWLTNRITTKIQTFQLYISTNQEHHHDLQIYIQDSASNHQQNQAELDNDQVSNPFLIEFNFSLHIKLHSTVFQLNCSSFYIFCQVYDKVKTVVSKQR